MSLATGFDECDGLPRRDDMRVELRQHFDEGSMNLTAEHISRILHERMMWADTMPDL